MEKSRLQKLEEANKDKENLLVELTHGRQQRKAAKEQQPEKIKPSRSGAFFACHRGAAMNVA